MSPPEEQYILRPPHGDTEASGQYWLLKKTLYGLKRSPKHWFDLMTQYLAQCGLTPCKQDPCIFQGNPIPGRPKLYLGLYYFVFANMFWLLNACNGIKKILRANRKNSTDF